MRKSFSVCVSVCAWCYSCILRTLSKTKCHISRGYPPIKNKDFHMLAGSKGANVRLREQLDERDKGKIQLFN